MSISNLDTEILSHVQRLDAEIQTLRRSVDAIAEGAEQRNDPFTVHITSLAPEPFQVTREIPVLVETLVNEDQEEEFVVRFVEANVGSSGESLEEAVRNLKARLISKLLSLEEFEDRLGPRPKAQLDVLRSVIARAT